MRAGDIGLGLLVILICAAPLLWFLGVPFDRVAGAVIYWTFCFWLVSWLGGRYGSES